MMDPCTALELAKKGSTLLLLDVPQFTIIGIDTQVFYVGSIFKGIKMIPPGPHFIYYRSSNKEGNEFSPIFGFFVTTRASEVLVRKWNQEEERLVKIPEDEGPEPLVLLGETSNQEEQLYVSAVRSPPQFQGGVGRSRLLECRYREAVKHFEFDHQLGPYGLDHYEEWRQLSDFITESTIEHIEPIGGEITIAVESGLFDEAPKTAMEEHMVSQLQLKNSIFSSSSTEKSQKQGCYYTAIPHVIKKKDISGKELTALNLDKTELLETILKKNFGGIEDLLLGELQFSFIAFLMGQSLEAFLQWKSLASLLFSCTEAPLHTRSQLFSKFLRVIYFQLKHGSDKEQMNSTGGERLSLFLDDAWFSKDTFLYRLCKEFFQLILECRVIDGDLLSWTRKLKRLLETSLGWDFETPMDFIFEEDDEFSPVIVPSNDISFDDS